MDKTVYNDIKKYAEENARIWCESMFEKNLLAMIAKQGTNYAASKSSRSVDIVKDINEADEISKKATVEAIKKFVNELNL